MDAGPQSQVSIRRLRLTKLSQSSLTAIDHEPQYFPSLDMAKSASAAYTWRGKKGQVVDGDGLYNTELGPTVKKVLPRGFGGPSPAVKAIFKGWMAFRKSQAMYRPNPPMPEGDVTPPGAIHARPAERVSKHRPYMTVGASLTRDATLPPPSAHVDIREFPDLEESPYVGLGGITGTQDACQVTTQRELAFWKPADGQGAPVLNRGHLTPSTLVRPCRQRARPSTSVLPAP